MPDVVTLGLFILATYLIGWAIVIWLAVRAWRASRPEV